MNNKIFFEAYVYISKKKFIICAYNLNDLNKIYEHEYLLENNIEEIDFKKFHEFLDKNILKLEKKLNNFIKKIHVIISTNNSFNIQLSVKNDNNGNILTPKNLSYSLNEARDQCKKTLENKKIIHMLIKNYRIDNKDYFFLPENLKCNSYSLDVQFICLSYDLLRKLEYYLGKYQILINKILCAEYIESYFEDNSGDLFKKVMKITEGCNPNEVKFVNKIKKNKGFFEKFFNVFK